MSYLGHVALSWSLTLLIALGFLLTECQSKPAHAGSLYLEGGGGGTIFQQTSIDGLWHQKYFPNGWDLHDTAFRLGARYDWEHWGLSAAMVSLGTIKVKDAGFVGDEHYDPVHHICTASCDKLSWLQATDQVRAYEVLLSYRWWFGEVAPFIGVGPALLTHRFTVTNSGSSQELYGRLPAIAGRAGICYGTGLQVCLDSTFYNPVKGVRWFGEPWYPLFENALVNMFTLRIPIN